MFKAASASALLNAFLSTMQITLGITAHSDGLFADGIHTLSDLAADAVVLLVLYLSAKHLGARARRAGHPDPHHADSSTEQALASLFIAVILIFTAAQMLWGSVAQTSTLSGNDAMNVGALAVSCFVMVAKETLFRYLRAQGRRTGSALLQASAWHARVDAVSALVATLGLAGSLAGLPMLDHIAGAAIGLMILRMGYASGRDAFRQLLAGSSGNAPTREAAD
ncbi:cation diffusion facilitator family transporter [Paraburkholderia fynbosensis]|uniref:Magnetosome protein MamB n=1 Tax=Paraburkholderia fynbosensis TaxID=1200993 RepID=A0A6J5G5L3_9BURK|nr:cation diffusion facilitator family transporter [Paraburkholderia fynbosensis]CAB3793725.1 Magnetosome protein MamB [Paraburkholderia fynbosensis]